MESTGVDRVEYYVSRAIEREAGIEACVDKEYYNIKGLLVRRGARVRIQLRGRREDELECELLCYSSVYGTFVLKCGNIYRIVRFRDVKIFDVMEEDGVR